MVSGSLEPEDDHLGVLEHVGERIEGLRHAEPPVEAVAVGGAPVPALPAVGVVENGRVAEQVHEAQEGSHLVAHDAPVVVRGGEATDRRGTVSVFHARDLAGDERQGLIPGDALIGRAAAVLGVALPGGVEVDALHGVLGALRRVEAATLGVHHGRQIELLRRRVGLAAGRDRPGPEVGRVGRQGADAHDHAVSHVDRHRPAVRAVGEYLFSHPATSRRQRSGQIDIHSTVQRYQGIVAAQGEPTSPPPVRCHTELSVHVADTSPWSSHSLHRREVARVVHGPDHPYAGCTECRQPAATRAAREGNWRWVAVQDSAPSCENSIF